VAGVANYLKTDLRIFKDVTSDPRLLGDDLAAVTPTRAIKVRYESSISYSSALMLPG
jgi:hypothetical protein